MRGIERVLAAIVLAGGVAGAAAFAHRAGEAHVQAFSATPLTEPVSHAADSATTIRVAKLPAVAVAGASARPARPAPVVVRRLALPAVHVIQIAPRRGAVRPAPVKTPVQAQPPAVVHAAPPAPAAPPAAPAPAPAAPAPAPTPPIAAERPATPPAPVTLTPTTPARAAPATPVKRRGKGHGKPGAKFQPVAETLATATTPQPAEQPPAPTVTVTVPTLVPTAEDDDDQGDGDTESGRGHGHGHGHGHDK